ncbi:uncharacterized protein LOC143913422 [Arctopsyche grandis]|uniref:uncharacterized protein LOC143913422 n=1 Tax=Arctopsyche grandis TaxID=121162 RepID=UPI00406D8C8D
MEWELLCRVCLQSGQDNQLVSLFDTDENNEPLKDKYLFCSDIIVNDTEPLPSNICLTCVDRLLSAYQFKRQCVSSNQTLKECLLEFKKSHGESEPSPKSAGTEVISIKQENGEYLRYEIPIEYESKSNWPNVRILSSEDAKKRRGRPRKYPDALGLIETSPYTRKGQKIHDLLKEESQTSNDSQKNVENAADKSSTSLENEESNDLIYQDFIQNDKPSEENETEPVLQLELDPNNGTFLQILKKSDDKVATKRKGKTKKTTSFENVKFENEYEKDEEDVLLKETILANSAPIPEELLRKDKKKQPKKYKYERVHTCDQCGSSFRSNASLQAHIRRHLGIKPFVCRICGYASVLNMELRRHMMRHTGVKPYECRYCGRFFSDFGSRQKHERLHVGDRPYQCTVCGKSFTYSYVLSNHMLTHTGEKKYSCGPCNKKFTKAHHLKYHNKIHHRELYLQEQILQDEKKKIQHINLSTLTSACTEQLVGLNQEMTIQDSSIELNQDLSQTNMINQSHNSKSFDLMKENIQIIQQYGNNDIKIEETPLKLEEGLP